ncbi:MAG TPA: M20/M25/M40 family metallo-hydrolase [Candidatus Kapabacteria bacterium]|nr:M20/M25/M40 family metallo-hydrolase [Candidatus Kapabacteria bacterium]
MKKIISSILFIFLINYCVYSNTDSIDFINKYRPIAEKIISYAYKDSSAWQRLAYMTDVYGPRLSGSKNLEKALDWMLEQMSKDNFDNVRAEKVMVTNWYRNSETAKLLYPREANIPITALGGSIATPRGGIIGEIVVVKDKKELDSLGKTNIEGKIVVYNQPFINYGQSVQYRFYGAQWAAKYGAIASLIRSVSPLIMRNLHTGVMAYNDSIPKIPHAAISPEDVMLLERLISYGIKPRILIDLDVGQHPDSESRNIMCEIKGSKYPDEIIALGGHTDSWDLGTGAQDDGSGVMSTWFATKLIKELGLKPKRTIRMVQWVNEENGAKGGIAYKEAHKNEKHILVFEHDSGVFPPSAIRLSGADSILTKLKYAEPLFKMIHDEMTVSNHGGGVDIEPMMDIGVPGMSLSTNGRGKYFQYHHSYSDMVDKVDPFELNQNIATIALAIYLYSDLEIDFPNNIKK